MTEINRQPSGLSNFLLVQAGGKNPDDLSQTVSPVIDIEPFYQPDRLRAAVKPFNLSPQQIEFVEVPADEVWKVINLAIVETGMSNNTSAIFYFGHERIIGQGLNGVPWISAELAPTQSNGTEAVFATDVVPRIITAGQRITLENASSDFNPAVGIMYVTYVLLDIGR